jgi:hypothetical protein
MYQYYKSFPGDKDRPEWLKYLDNLLLCGREYFINKPDNEPAYSLLSDKEIIKLSALMLKELPSTDQYDAIFDFDIDNYFPNLVIDCMLDNDILSKSIISNFLSDLVVKHFSDHLKKIFEEIHSDSRTFGVTRTCEND